MRKGRDLEYIGYSVLSNFCFRVYKVISKLGSKFLKLSNKLRFEQYKILFNEREDDIYVVSYPKSGTTILQMILYQLTTDGKMNFSHIDDVSPWIRNASYKNLKPASLPSPRIIKSHDYHNEFTKNTKGRFIYVYRNGMDAAVSLYHQEKNYNKSDLELKTFIKNFLKKKTWFKHTRSWFENKNNFPILYIRYEDILNDKLAIIKRIINFCKLNVNDEYIERALKYSSFDYMKKQESKFGIQPIENKKVFDQFIRKGMAGEGDKYFNTRQKNEFIRFHDRIVKPYEQKIYLLDNSN